MSPIIRLATDRDCEAVETIVASAYGGYVERIGRKPGPMLDDYPALIARGVVHVLDEDGATMGLVVLVPERDAMLLDNVAVRPGVKGQGYGKLLLQFAERTAIEAGYEILRLYTHEMMTENRALYSRIGFVETHRAEEHRFSPGIFMAKRLAP